MYSYFFPSGLFPPVFFFFSPPKNPVWTFLHVCYMPRPSHPHRLILTIFGEERKQWGFLYSGVLFPRFPYTRLITSAPCSQTPCVCAFPVMWKNEFHISGAQIQDARMPWRLNLVRGRLKFVGLRRRTCCMTFLLAPRILRRLLDLGKFVHPSFTPVWNTTKNYSARYTVIFMILDGRREQRFQGRLCITFYSVFDKMSIRRTLLYIFRESSEFWPCGQVQITPRGLFLFDVCV